MDLRPESISKFLISSTEIRSLATKRDKNRLTRKSKGPHGFVLLEEEELRIGSGYFLASPSAITSDKRDINRYAGLSTDHIVSGMSSHEIAMAIFPFCV